MQTGVYSILAGLAVGLIATAAGAQTATLTLDDTVIAPKGRLGIGVNGGTSWYDFVGANLVDDPSFEGAEDENGFARDGWPWSGGDGTSAGVETSGAVTGDQCQRVTVTGAPASMRQGRVDLPQLPHIRTATPDRTYRIKVQAKADTDGARIRLGVVDDGWQAVLGPEIGVGTDWTVVSWDYVPAAEHLLRGIAVGFADNATYWLDDLVAWDPADIDTATGLSAVYVERLRELQPATLRLGGLGVNGIPLESYLRRRWDRSYGPPDLQPDFDLNTFLLLCREVGAQPFITVPPAFSDDTHWQIGDLTDEVIAGFYTDHGNLIDYLGGDTTTAYGARREADGHTRWDLEFEVIYLELGNELWGTPDDHWDMDPAGDESLEQQMNNFATYNQVRMTEMKSRPGWRQNMRVGFCGRGPETWMGGWPGSYDGTLVPAIGHLTDFHTIDLYYGAGAAGDSDEQIYGALFANAPMHERQITTMKAAFRAANGGTPIETTVYEGNATWGGYEPDLHNPSPLYFKEVSLGAAVSLVDLHAAANRAGVTVNNHFHYGGNVWGATGPYPEVVRKPAFRALKLFNRHLSGGLVGCTVEGGGSWDDELTGEPDVPYLACYPYLEGDVYTILMINRHRTEARQVVIPHRLAPLRTISLTGSDINANNETGEAVTLQTEELNGTLQDQIELDLPAHSAVVLVASKTGEVPPDGGIDADGDAGGDVGGNEGGEDGGDADLPGDEASTSDKGPGNGKIGGDCGCGTTHGLGAVWLLLLVVIARIHPPARGARRTINFRGCRCSMCGCRADRTTVQDPNSDHRRADRSSRIR